MVCKCTWWWWATWHIFLGHLWTLCVPILLFELSQCYHLECGVVLRAVGHIVFDRKSCNYNTALHTSRSAHTAANANTHVDMAILSCSQMDRPTVQKNINQDTNILHCNLSELFYYLTFCNHLSFCSCVRCFALLCYAALCNFNRTQKVCQPRRTNRQESSAIYWIESKPIWMHRFVLAK